MAVLSETVSLLERPLNGEHPLYPRFFKENNVSPCRSRGSWEKKEMLSPLFSETLPVLYRPEKT